MGFFSSDSQTTQQTTNFVDSSTVTANQAGAEAGVAGDNNRVTIYKTETDQGAVGGLVDVSGRAISFGSDAIKNALEFGADAINNTLGFGDNALNNALTFSSESSARSFEMGAGSVDAAFRLSTGIAAQSTAAANEALVKSINSANSQSAAAYQFATSVARPNDANTSNLKIIGAVVAVIAVAFILKMKA